jgi:electron transfer flavoprotein alpha subunit
MPKNTGNDIWVFVDLRSQRFFGATLAALTAARGLAASTGGQVWAVVVESAAFPPAPGAPDGGCVSMEAAQEQCFQHGANRLWILSNRHPGATLGETVAAALSAAVAEQRPKLVVFSLTELGREVAARTAARCQGGLIADCIDLRVDIQQRVVGRCPAWGGSIVAEIGFVDDWGTGFATLQLHSCAASPLAAGRGTVQRHQPQVSPVASGLRWVASQAAPRAQRQLETAPVVVVGGAGLGSADNFARVRELAAVLGGQVGATRPPVMQHWVEESRLIGQTGKRVAPRLLISVGTSGAIQYTAGIGEAECIVAINRDAHAPIFNISDIGIVADANQLLPELVAGSQQALMRRMADDVCITTEQAGAPGGLGAQVRKLRKARDWSIETLAQATGQSPEFIEKVEADRISPPVAFLLRLAGALSIDPGTFLRPEAQVAIRDQRMAAYVRRTQNYSYQSLTEGLASDHLRAFMVTIEPYHDHKPVAYKHEGEEFIFVMEGDLELTLDTKANLLKSGESIHFNSNVPHKLKSLSKKPTRCLVVLYTL